MKEIPLSQGMFALVDDDMYDELSQYTWFAHKDTHTYYAGRSVRMTNGKNKQFWMHRLIMDAKKGQIIDHKDRNGLNNQKDNLRLADHSLNQANRTKYKTTASIYYGISVSEKQGIKASIRVNKKYIHLGYFNTEEEAAYAYDEAALKYFGEFANLNFPKVCVQVSV